MNIYNDMAEVFSEKRKRSFLFLQFIASPFAWKLGRALKGRGHDVCRVNFCGADILFWPFGARWYRHGLEAWPAYLTRLVREEGITDILLFGDARPFHRAALDAVQHLPIRVHVFEEGYFRPHWITMEKEGTNGWSSLPRTPEGLKRLAATLPSPDETALVAGGAGRRAWFEIGAAMASALMRPVFPRYRRHRQQLPLIEGLGWLRRFATGAFRSRHMKCVYERIISEGRPYFLFPLQLPGDSQIKVHSPFRSMTEALDRVLESFGRCAPADTLLVVKRHPLDNAVFDFEKYTLDQATRLGIASRVIFLDGGHLPTLIRRSRGMVTVNSTAGIQALHHQCPTKTLGKAIYDLPGLTSRRSLDEFWLDPDCPDAEFFATFRHAVMGATQINGNFYTPLGIRRAVEGALARLEVAEPEVIRISARGSRPLPAAPAPAPLVSPRFAMRSYPRQDERR
jgi:capsular polysaccharide export protein